MCKYISKYYFHLISSFLFLAVISINSQPIEEWVNRYNSPANVNDNGKYVAVDNSGNVYVTGNTGNDITTIKYSSAGAELWTKTYSTSPDNEVIGIVVDGLGNIIIAGNDFQTNTDMMVFKYDQSGNLLWLQHYSGSAHAAHDIAQTLVCDANNNVYISGTSEKDSPGQYELVTIKYSSSGVLQWVNKTDATQPFVSDMKLDLLGNIYICGALSASNTDAFLAKISASGTLLFMQTYDYTLAAGWDNFQAMAINEAGTDIYVTGSSWGGTTTGTDFVTIKYKTSGVSQWVQRYNGLVSGSDEPYSIVIDKSGNVYSAGVSYGGVTANKDVAIAKYSSSGTPIGYQRYSVGSNVEEAYNIRIDANQNLYLAGYNNGDVLILKFNSALILQWSKMYNSPANGNDATSDMILDNSGNLYITGYSMGIGTNYDYLTIKYSQVVGITQNSNEVPEAYTLHQNYPNPFNPSTNIKFDIPKDSDVKIAVYDMLGKEVKILVEEHKQAGSYELNFDASKLSSGMYFYKLTAGSFTGIKKMILIK